MRTYGTTAYAVSDNVHRYRDADTPEGIVVMDLSNVASGVVPHHRLFEGPTNNTHNIYVDTEGGYLYRLGGVPVWGMRIYDIHTDPLNPKFVAEYGRLDAQGNSYTSDAEARTAGAENVHYIHDMQLVHVKSGPHSGKQIAFCAVGFEGPYDREHQDQNNGLWILDVTDKDNIQPLSYTGYPRAGYGHQVAVSEDLTRAYLTDELNSFPWPHTPMPSTWRTFDITDFTAAAYLGSFTNNENTINHNCFVESSLMYCANYESGLRVLDLSVDKNAPPEVAFFDTHPADEAQCCWGGAWGLHKFPSGTVALNDINRGLLLVKVTVEAAHDLSCSLCEHKVGERPLWSWPADCDTLESNSCFDLKTTYQTNGCCAPAAETAA
jgi:choice-of-anchor B domain-containing protein